MYPIAIPSRGRAGDVITIQSLPSAFYPRVILFVPKEELDLYRNRHAFFLLAGGKIETVSDYSHKISEKRNLMAHWLNANLGVDYFWMMDDDLKFFYRMSEDDKRLVISQECDYEQMFGAAEHKVEDEPNRFCAVGVSMRQGNNVMEWPGAWNTRLIRCGLFRMSTFLNAKHNRLRFMGDFDVMIQMLKMGYDNYVMAEWAQDHRGTNAKGGCETSRDEVAMEESANSLAAIHFDCVTTKQKENKNGKLATRTDVTIYWKKARKAGPPYPDF